MKTMTKSLSPDEAVELAQQAHDARITTIRALAETRQALTEVRETAERERAELEAQIAERSTAASRADKKAYHAALRAGWSSTELRRIGYPDLTKKRRRRQKTTDAADNETSDVELSETPQDPSPLTTPMDSSESPSAPLL